MYSKFIISALCALFLCNLAFAQGYVANYNSHIVESYYGVIVDKQWVQYDTYAGDNEGIGTVAGAITGAAVGSAFGGGNGRIATALGGSFLGGLLGNSIGRNTPSYHSHYMFEYTLRLNDGSLKTVLQNPNMNLALGQRVLLERSSDGRWFFVPY